MHIRPATQVLLLTLLTVSVGLAAVASALPTAIVPMSTENLTVGADEGSWFAFNPFALDRARAYAGPGDPTPNQVPGWSETSEFMIGSVAVGVILMESDGGVDTETEDWTAAERTNVRNEIEDSLDWWDDRAFDHDVPLDFTIDWTNLNTPIDTGYEPINRPHSDENLWMQDAMDDLGHNSFGSHIDNIRDYANALRNTHSTDWGFVIFIVDSSFDVDNEFTDGWFGYARLGGPRYVMTYGNNGWGIGQMNRVASHETGHIFYALDEYAASGCAVTDRSGYFDRTNDNCVNGGTGHDNIMNHNTVTGASPRIETREQIGWRDTDGDDIHDILDTFPTNSLNAYSPDPTTDPTPTYSGSAEVNPLTNNNPRGPGNDLTILEIANVQFNVDGGAWQNAQASDGSFNEHSENYYFTTPALTGGVHTICARAVNGVANIGGSSCDNLQIDGIPEAHAGPNQIVDEGETVTFDGSGSTDDIGIVEYRWDFDASDGVSFSPPDATGVSPTHEYGDNGVYTVTLQVEDTAGSKDTDTMTVTVLNVEPSVDAGSDITIDEADTASINAFFSDAGWLDTHTGSINYGEGTVDVAAISEENVKPDSTGWATGSHVYGDNGVFTVTVTVCDDDGACDTDTLSVTVNNVAPSVTFLHSVTIDEAQTATLKGEATDPGSDDLTFDWSWGYRSVCDTSTTYLNDPLYDPDPTPSPTVNPRAVVEARSCQYGDNGAFTVTLTVTDDDGLATAASTTVTVDNVDPVIDPTIRVYVKVNVTLRAAGEKWHDVEMTLYEDGTTVATASVTRYPGDPDDQSVTVNDVEMDILACSSSAVVEYTPMDDPINGQINGATPAWLILTFEDGRESRLHHTFNVRHPDTWIWTISDFCPYIDAVGLPIYFEATASDVGSDDLTFTWSWDDATADTSTTYFNNGASADPFPSPDISPITESDAVTHTYSSSGTYNITLKVTDDDTGEATRIITLTI